MPSQPLETLTRYKAWANERLYTMLAGLSPDQLAAPTPIFAGSILRTLNHVYLMDVAWKSHLLGVHDLTTRNPEAAPPLPNLREAQRDIDAWYIDYAAAMTPANCDDVVRFMFIGGGDGSLRREDIVLHAVNHTTYHRGISRRCSTCLACSRRRPICRYSCATRDPRYRNNSTASEMQSITTPGPERPFNICNCMSQS